MLGCLLEIVLKNNCFEFDGTYYKQLQDTAVGTKLAPAYANIFMGYLEHNGPHSETGLSKFLSAMNNIHPSIELSVNLI